MAVSDYSTDPNQNNTISGINIGEGMPPANVNNAMRQMMVDTKGLLDNDIPTTDGLMVLVEMVLIIGVMIAMTVGTVLSCTNNLANRSTPAVATNYEDPGSCGMAGGTGITVDSEHDIVTTTVCMASTTGHGLGKIIMRSRVVMVCVTAVIWRSMTVSTK